MARDTAPRSAPRPLAFASKIRGAGGGAVGDRGLGEPVPTPGQIPAEVARDGRTARQHRVRRLRRAGPFPESAGGPSSSHWGLCRTPHKRTKERGKRGWRGSRRVTAGGGRRLRSVTKPQVRAPAVRDSEWGVQVERAPPPHSSSVRAESPAKPQAVCGTRESAHHTTETWRKK